MAEESDPIGDAEALLRRIPTIADRYNPALEIPLTAAAFRPTDDDIDGISVFRHLFCSPDDIAARYRPKSCVVGEFSAADAREIGLSIVPDPLTHEDQLRGHALIPEINTTRYRNRAQKRAVKELCYALAKLASDKIHGA